MKSSNTEHEERLFGQSKDLVSRASNRQPTTVIPNVLLRLQAKQKRGDIFKSYKTSSGRVAKEVQQLGECVPNTTISKDFLTSRMSSWQAHIQRVSPFLLLGKGVWWRSTESGYEFLDGTEENERQEGPPLHHFRDTRLEEVYKQNASVWQLIIEEGIVLPTPYIKLYDSSGNCTGRKFFQDNDQPQVLPVETQPHQDSPEPQGSAMETQPPHTFPQIQGSIETQLPILSSTETRLTDVNSMGKQNHNDSPSFQQPEVDAADEISEGEEFVQIKNIDQCEDEDEVQPENTLQTMLARAIVKALDCNLSAEILQLDKVRHQIKHKHQTAQLLSDFASHSPL
jgi:hypothetical protein